MPEFAWWREAFIAELTSFPNGAFDDWVDALAQALNELRGNPLYKNAADSLKLIAAYDRLRQGMSVETTAARVDLTTSEVQRCKDRVNRLREEGMRKRSLRRQNEDDPGALWDATAVKQVEGFKAGAYFGIGYDQYMSYLRGRLINMSDPAAAALMSHLDRRWRIT